MTAVAVIVVIAATVVVVIVVEIFKIVQLEEVVELFG